MKFIGLLLSVSLTLPVLANASGSWTCAANGTADAVRVSANPSPGEFSEVIEIKDSSICSTLGLTCPYSTPAKEDPTGNYIGIAGEYATGVVLMNDSGGMKIYRAQTDHESGRLNLGANWYFNPGDCQSN